MKTDADIHLPRLTRKFLQIRDLISQDEARRLVARADNTVMRESDERLSLGKSVCRDFVVLWALRAKSGIRYLELEFVISHAGYFGGNENKAVEWRYADHGLILENLPDTIETAYKARISEGTLRTSDIIQPDIFNRKLIKSESVDWMPGAIILRMNGRWNDGSITRQKWEAQHYG